MRCSRKPHSTHFSLDEAVAVVEKLKPKRARFTHIAHSLSHAAVNARLTEGVRLAFDGERILVDN